MKKYLLVLSCLFTFQSSYTQSNFAAELSGLISKDTYKAGKTDFHYNNMDSVFNDRYGFNYNMGIYVSSDESPSVFMYRWGFSVFNPVSDSIPVTSKYYSNDFWGNSVLVEDTLTSFVKSNRFEINFKVSGGYKPFETPFFNIYGGAGFSILRYKHIYTFQDSVDLSTFSIFDKRYTSRVNDTKTMKGWSSRLNLHGGAQYEFNKFRIFAEANAYIPIYINDTPHIPISITYNLGIIWHLSEF